MTPLKLGLGRGGDPENVGGSGMGLPRTEEGALTLFSQQQLISVGHTGHASQLHSHTGPGHGKTA